jgi:Xaa-Pro aminopeptidase
MNYPERLKRIRQKLSHLPCEALLIDHSTDLFYLTGLELSAGKLLISQTSSQLIVDGRYHEKSLSQTLYPVCKLSDDAVNEWLLANDLHSLGFDINQTTYLGYTALNQMVEELKSKNHPLEVIPIEPVVQEMRMIKDQEEIACLRAAARLGYQGYEYVVSLLREGILESEIAFELEFFWRKLGAKKLAFDSIIAFGPNSSMPHYHAGSAPLTQDTHILIDIGVVLDHYHSDMSRVVFFGTPPEPIRNIFPIVEEAQQKAIELCRPGTPIKDLDDTARKIIESHGYGESFTHSLGHGLGLNIHEPPIIRRKGPYSELLLQPGMVITIEPGIYLPRIGGVRIEDTILITEEGHEVLSSLVPIGP